MRGASPGWRCACGAPKQPSRWLSTPRAPVVFATSRYAALPAEVGLRLLGKAVAHCGDEGPVELAKLEALYEALRQARSRLRRTLAGAVVTLAGDRLTVERAPARRAPGGRGSRRGPRTAD